MIGIVIWEVRGTLANTWGIAHLAPHSRHVPLGLTHPISSSSPVFTTELAGFLTCPHLILTCAHCIRALPVEVLFFMLHIAT
jgi:hypothetical protein